MTSNCKKWYKAIVRERNKLLKESKQTGDYKFCVAHGMTETLRIYDKLFETEE